MSSSDLRKKVHEIIDNSDDEILKAVYTLLQAADTEYVLGTTIEKYNQELEEAEADIDSGKFMTRETLLKEAEKW